jgi:myo-inositol 2-dehydrogenase/D-chiro-inositol 1-dehydrogenase
MAAVGFGVIGAGAIGRLHAQHLASRVPGARLVAVSDVVRAAAEACAEATGAAAYEDHRDLLADPQVEAVVIASPPDTHAAMIEEAAAAGKQVFCEKPIDCELDKIDRALAAVARAGVKLQIGFNRRFDANYRAVREAVVAGKIGRPLILHIISRDPTLPVVSDTRDAAGLFLDMTIHDFDMARYLIGAEVTEVRALAGRTLHDAGDLDTALITLRFASGTFGSIDNGQTAYGYDQRAEVFGTEGMVSTDNEKADHATLTDSAGSHSAVPLYFFIERYAESYLRELREFVDCIRNDTKPPVTGADGRAAVVIALAAQRSYEEDRPVLLSEFGEE